MYATIPLIPQVVRDESELAAKPFYIDSKNMRSVNGKMETQYGQELFTSSALTGVCRGGITYTDLSRVSWVAFGTHLRLQVADQDGALSDITPVIERGELSSAFTVSSGSASISVNDVGHDLAVDQKITFPTASSAANVLISGSYTVSSVANSSVYAFTASTSATQSTAGVGPSVIDYEYHLKPGNESNLGGLGFGVGGYGSGGYGGASTSQDLDARTYTFAPWGQNLIANPNWGGVFEWAPNTSASELINTGDFSSTGNWVLGSGWSLGGGGASAASAARLSQSISLSRSAWHLLDFDVQAYTTGSVITTIAGSTIGANITATGTYKRAFFSPANSSATLVLDGSSAFTGRIDNVSVKVLATGHQITNSPSSVGSIFVTAERNLVACGATNPANGLLDPMRVAWSAEENNQDWTSTAGNDAGGRTLSHGSRIIRGMPGNRENLIFTDTAVYRMRSVPDPSVVYAFDLIGESCGLIGPNAVVQVNGVFFWVSQHEKFFTYAGGAPVPIPNPSDRDFMDNLADVQGQKICAAALTNRGEVSFFYPDERDGIENSRHHTFNYLENTWVSGDGAAWTTQIDAGTLLYPVATDPSGYVYYKEKDFSNDGSARTTTLESSYFTVGKGKGDNFASIMGVRPDFDDMRGGATITFYSKNYPNDPTPRTYGPYNITTATKWISVRVKGRQIKFKIETNDAPSFYRLGDMTFDIKESGQRK